MRGKFLFWLTVGLTVCSGVTTILSAFAFYHHNGLIDPAIGFNPSRVVIVLIGLTQLYVALNLLQFKRMAWWLTVLMSIVAFVAQYLQHSHSNARFLPLLLLLLLLATRNQFTVRSEPVKIISGLRRACFIVAVGTSAGAVALWEVNPVHFGVDLSLWQAILHSVQIVLLGQDNLHPLTRHADQFLDTLHFLGIVSYGFVLYSLFRPLYDRFVLTPHNLREVERLLQVYGKSSEDIFKLWPTDKSYFFQETHEGFVAYRVARGCAIALADPISASHQQLGFMRQFSVFARQHGWIPAFIHVPESSTTHYEAAGYKLLKMGENAVVHLETFASTTTRNKHFRNVANRFNKSGHQVEFYSPPHSIALLHELQTISNSWLQLPGRSERSFGLGFFDESYLQMSQVSVLRDANGHAVAFVSEQPNYSKTQASIDLMRHIENAAPNAMDFLLQQVLLKAVKAGWKTFDLGLVPLAGVGQEKAAPFYEKLMAIFYERGDKVFAFSGLYRFKNKFAPTWQASYVAYEGGSRNLARIALALAKLLR